LVQAIAHSHASDALHCALSTAQWELLASYMTRLQLVSGQVLIEQGAHDRTIFLIESGTLAVHFEDEKAHIRMALVGPGSVLGEGAFFSHAARSASASASGPAAVWSLSPMRFAELSRRHSDVALELCMGLGSVVAKRLYSRPKRVAVT
jgi:CRP/FNR family transcriptional regulator, cyclic AMP receptor protein